MDADTKDVIIGLLDDLTEAVNTLDGTDCSMPRKDLLNRLVKLATKLDKASFYAVKRLNEITPESGWEYRPSINLGKRNLSDHPVL